jgi:hypothetical protein
MTAKELFTGRLTEEILLQRLDGLTPEAVIELDLSNCKLRYYNINIYKFIEISKIFSIKITTQI